MKLLIDECLPRARMPEGTGDGVVCKKEWRAAVIG
jgi:hypothetical protein